VLTNFPNFSQRKNYAAEAANLYDLKSETLSVLLEQMILWMKHSMQWQMILYHQSRMG
jgi:hypothetical protein